MLERLRKDAWEWHLVDRIKYLSVSIQLHWPVIFPCRLPQGLPNISLPGWLQNRGSEASPSAQPSSQQQQQQQVAGKTCFPAKLCMSDGAGGTRCSQDLLTVGSRQWGHPAISSLLRVKIYDFALYMDGEQVCPAPWHGAGGPQVYPGVSEPVWTTHEGCWPLGKGCVNVDMYTWLAWPIRLHAAKRPQMQCAVVMMTGEGLGRAARVCGSAGQGAAPGAQAARRRAVLRSAPQRRGRGHGTGGARMPQLPPPSAHQMQACVT